MLLVGPAGEGAIDHLDDFFSGVNPKNVIDLGHLEEEVFFFALGEAASDNDAFYFALFFQSEHFANNAEGFLSRRFNETAGVDDDEVGAVGVGRQRVAILDEFAQHALGVYRVFRATQTDESKRAFLRGCFIHTLGSPRGTLASS